jgi:ATP-dependent DNA helicase RecQ
MKKHVVGRLASKFQPPEGMQFVRGEVTAIVERRAEDGAEAFRAAARRESWEVVVPEIVFEAAAGG